jgi:hypothetical protein
MKAPGYKVAWIERPSQWLFDFYSRISRLAPPHPGHVLVAISNQKVCSNYELAKIERKQPQTEQVSKE